MCSSDLHEASNVPGASAWHWEFGDGTSSDEREPVHVYTSGGSFDVRLTVTGSGGQAHRQKAAFVVVQAPPRELEPAHPSARPTPRVLAPR